MKKFAKILLLGLISGGLLVFSGCGDNDEESIFIATEIFGTWESEAVNLTITFNGQDLAAYLKSQGYPQSDIDEFVEGLDELSSEFSGLSFTFNSDNTFTSQYTGEDPEEGSWSLNESNKELVLLDGMDSEDYELPSFQVLHLDASKLILSLKFDFAELFGGEIDFDDDGKADTFIFDYTINFTR